MGLKERVSSVGGELQIGSSPKGGFEFDIKVPA